MESRELVESLKAKGMSERKACGQFEIARSTVQYQPKPEDPRNRRIREELRRLSRRRRRWGSPRMTHEIREKLFRVNHKRIERLWRLEGLQVPRKRRRRRPGSSDYIRPRPATRPNEVWSFDFIHGRTEYGEKLKMLTVLDEYTRECLEIRVEKRMDSNGVLETLDELMTERGAPRYTRTDNGPEFVAGKLRRWLREKGVLPVLIDPGSPWQNGFVESFHGKLRDECLDGEMFFSRAEAQVIVDGFRQEYNTERPHSALGYKTPAQMARESFKVRRN